MIIVSVKIVKIKDSVNVDATVNLVKYADAKVVNV
jgi:hypothetical protein